MSRGVALRTASIGAAMLAAAVATPAAAAGSHHTPVAQPAVSTIVARTDHAAPQHIRPGAHHDTEPRVDRAGYVPATPIDPYQADRTAIHVSMAAGQPLALGWFHVTLDGAKAANLSTLRVSFPTVVGLPVGSASLTVSPAIVEACALTQPLPATVTSSSMPASDCAAASAVGKATGASWTFPLRDLVRYWQRHGDTGAELLPIAATPVATWGASFSISGATATLTHLVTVHPSGHPAATHQAPRQPASTTDTALTPAAPSMPAAAASPTTATAPEQESAPVVATPGTRLVAASTGHGVLDQWPWVLVGCVLLALGSVGIAHRELVARELRRQVPPIITAMRTHPRAYGVAAAALAWGLVFTGYAVVHTGGSSNGAATLTDSMPPDTTQSGTSSTSIQAGPTGTVASGRSGHSSGSATASPVPGLNQPGTAPRTSPTATEFKGKGHWTTIDGTRVFFPANGGVPTADLYQGSADTIGITPNSLTLCAHAALTYGAAFNISASDLNVYWDWVNAHGGIYGRKVSMTYNNDNYDPTTAVQAAQKCKDINPFFLIGGIGFDQIPAVRQWAEQNKMLYLYHDAIYQGSQNLHYSFTALPTVEALGHMFGELDLAQFKGEKVGILYRQSPNWQPGSDQFEQVVKAGGGDIVDALPVQNNQGNYVQDLATLHSKGAQVVFAWENALATTEMIKQAQSLNWHPAWLVFPFNLETNTLGASSLDQPIWGVASWDAYDPKYDGGPFTPYRASIREFEAQYKQYDPHANLSGDGGDLLYLNWEGQAFIAYLMQKCGPDCTRNRFAGLLLSGFKYIHPPACPIDFDTGDHHDGGATMNIVKVVKDPTGRPNFYPVKRCVTSYP